MRRVWELNTQNIFILSLRVVRTRSQISYWKIISYGWPLLVESFFFNFLFSLQLLAELVLNKKKWQNYKGTEMHLQNRRFFSFFNDNNGTYSLYFQKVIGSTWLTQFGCNNPFNWLFLMFTHFNFLFVHKFFLGLNIYYSCKAFRRLCSCL